MREAALKGFGRTCRERLQILFSKPAHPGLECAVFRRAVVQNNGLNEQRISSANTHDLSTWFQSKVLHVCFNITSKDRSV